jgi:hypothetical protein
MARSYNCTFGRIFFAYMTCDDLLCQFFADREMMWVAVLEPEPKQEHCKAIWELRKSP